ncbi:MAG: 2Fe-2S iron-sulfur cluster binding domain-containing protein [Burkholderiales bacterium]|nr:2Fe-2S iron-sulfur cluster binding domain-containing protein [Burkholderiales bacterium]
MTTHLILQGGGMAAPLELDTPSGGKLIDPVRELARDGKLPLYWRCGQGTCGACLVRLEHAQSAQALPLALGGKERNVLARAGKLDEAQHTAATLPDTPDLPRLACHVVLRPGRLIVRWD